MVTSSSSTGNNSYNRKLRLSKLLTLEDIEYEIIRFDDVLKQIQDFSGHDWRITELTDSVSDKLFQLEQKLYGTDILGFTSPQQKEFVN